MWEVVRKLTGKRHDAAAVNGITVKSLNDQFATISTDASYTLPLSKNSASDSDSNQYITEYSVSQYLDKLRHTATGLDGLPVWFLILGAPIFSKPIARLFNLSLHLHCSAAMEDRLHPSYPQSLSAQEAR
jgi:hypothetical protein